MLNDPDLTIEKIERTGKRITIVLLIICAIVIGIMAYKILTRPKNVEPLITIHEERKIERYMKERKIRPPVIEIHYNGRMFYDLNGQKCEIK